MLWRGLENESQEIRTRGQEIRTREIIIVVLEGSGWARTIWNWRWRDGEKAKGRINCICLVIFWNGL
jgi:hypothetical protein